MDLELTTPRTEIDVSRLAVTDTIRLVPWQ